MTGGPVRTPAPTRRTESLFVGADVPIRPQPRIISRCTCRGGYHPPATRDQLPWLRQTRRCDFSAKSSKFWTGQGPVPPRQEEPAVLSLPAGRVRKSFWMASLVKRGSGGRRHGGPGGSAAGPIAAPPGAFLVPFWASKKEQGCPYQTSPKQIHETS